jgi:predicted nucleic acid-binding protein
VTLVVDASVATKWVLPEDGSERATALRNPAETFMAPNLIAAEIGNAIWKRVMWQDFLVADGLVALGAAMTIFSQIVPMEALAPRAVEIGAELKHPIYDCFYLALAERERCPMVTADKRLLTAVKKYKGAEVRAL